LLREQLFFVPTRSIKVVEKKKNKLGVFSLIGASASCSSYQHPRRDLTTSLATETGPKQIEVGRHIEFLY
jgi:hypothetical protein